MNILDFVLTMFYGIGILGILCAVLFGVAWLGDNYPTVVAGIFVFLFLGFVAFLLGLAAREFLL